LISIVIDENQSKKVGSLIVIFIACVSFTITLINITTTETTKRNILDLTSFFPNLPHSDRQKYLSPE